MRDFARIAFIPRLMGADHRFDDASTFLSTLDPGATAFEFRTFDNSGLKRPELIHTSSGLIDRVHKSLSEFSGRGAGVYVTINETEGKGISAENVTRVRALFADLDGAPLSTLTRLKLQPLIIVSTSPGRYHAYYLVEDVPLDEFKGLQRRLIALFGSDLPRVMRLPGFQWRLNIPTQ